MVSLRIKNKSYGDVVIIKKWGAGKSTPGGKKDGMRKKFR
jgi:hypothetical protein